MDLIVFDSLSKEPLYIQLYLYYKAAIEQNRLRENEKLPSIRALSRSLSVSKITVEKAYQQLMSEGYIKNYNRSRYTVNKLEEIVFNTPAVSMANQCHHNQEIKEKKILYDFSSGEMDRDGFDFSLWKRYISKLFFRKSVLLDMEMLKGKKSCVKKLQSILKNQGAFMFIRNKS